jgi:hypothetical protein
MPAQAAAPMAQQPLPQPGNVPTGSVPTPASAPAPAPAPAPVPGPESATTVEVAAPAAPPAADARPAPADAPAEYRESISRIVQAADAGQHAAAVALAAALERQAFARHGESAAPSLHVRQVRAHVSRLAGHQALAADLYRDVALKLLTARGAEHPETQQAVSNADACWRAVHDIADARRIAPSIIALRGSVPGPQGRKLRAAERYLAQLGQMGQNM